MNLAVGNRAAVVTGGGGGIGREVAMALGQRGVAVGVADIRLAAAEQTAKAVNDAGGRSLAVEMDVTDFDSVRRGCKDIGQAYGPVTIAATCAGWDEMRPFIETDEEQWNRVLEINYIGVLRITSCLLGGMIEAGWGRLVNVSSDSGRVGSSFEASYAGAKGAVIAFTKSVAREVARNNVTANVVCPGPTDTPLLASVVGDTESAKKILEAMKKAVPMRRLGQPAEVAAAVAFLASDDAGFITGQTLSVSGGLTMA